MGETQEILVDAAIVLLFVVLFYQAQRGQKDLRLRCWMVGWLGVGLHFLASAVQAGTNSASAALEWVSVSALVVAAACFAGSTMIRTEGVRSAVRLMLVLLVTTMACLAATSAGLAGWKLMAVVLARQVLAMALAARKRARRGVVGTAIGAVIATATVWMVAEIAHGRPEVVPTALLSEMYLVVAIDFWANGWTRTRALKLLTGGMVAWGAVFPVGYLLGVLLPAVQLDREVWNLPKFFVAVGMILVVLEEDMRAARSLLSDYQLLFENNPQGLWIVDAATLNVMAANRVALEMHGMKRAEFVGHPITNVIDPEVQLSVVTQLRSTERRMTRASRHLRKDGSPITLDISAYDIQFEGHECRFVMAVDVSERTALEVELDRTMHVDQLTGLSNRQSFRDQLTRAVSQAMGAGEKLAVLSLDIDRFRHVNDMYGQRVGDEYLQRVAEILTTRVRSTDVVARTAGGEFTLILTGLKSAETAMRAVEDLVNAFHEPILVSGYKIQRTVSVGGALAPDNGESAYALWRGADHARAQAKTQGGDRSVWLSEELYSEVEERRLLEEYMRSHLRDGGFYLLYQPLYGGDGRVHGLEALLRLTHPTLGQVSPARLVPVAEDTGLILELGAWAIEEVCRQLLKWKSEGVELVPVAVNVSALQIMHENFARDLMRTLTRYGIEPRMVHLEVTESVAMRNVSEVADRMAALAALGIHFSIDDFGTGHSSLARLSQLTTSELKIDRSFLEPACMGTSHSIVQAIITMAHALGHVVVAEGVENEAQLKCLRELHCDLYQGFLLSRPVPPDEVAKLIASEQATITGAPKPLWQETPRPRLVI